MVLHHLHVLVDLIDPGASVEHEALRAGVPHRLPHIGGRRCIVGVLVHGRLPIVHAEDAGKVARCRADETQSGLGCNRHSN